MYCRKCGTPNPDDRSNCLQCNAPLTSSLPQKPAGGPVSSGPMQNQNAPTSAFTEQPPSPTVIIPSQQSTGRPSPTTGPITNPTPPPYQPYQQQPPTPSYHQQPTQYQQQQTMQQSPQMSYGAPPPQSQANMNTLSIVAVIAGSVGLLTFCCYGLGIIPSAAGLIMGFMAMKKVQETGERGRELAIAGMVTGGIGTLLGIVYIILIIIGVVSSSMR